MVGTTSALASQWNVDVKAATMYYNPSNGSASYYLFSNSQTARVDTTLTVRNKEPLLLVRTNPSLAGNNVVFLDYGGTDYQRLVPIIPA